MLSSLSALPQDESVLALPLVLCQVNADDHREIGEKFGVRGFPTIKFFGRGKPTTSPEE